MFFTVDIDSGDYGRANPLRGQLGWGWALEIFLGKLHRAVRRMPFEAVASAVNLNHKTYYKSTGNCTRT